MAAALNARWVLEQECRALLTRLDRLDYFAVIEPMVAAAAPAPEARVNIERFLFDGRRLMRHMVTSYLISLRKPANRAAGPEELQHRFCYVRLRFNSLLSDFDTFSDVMTQRSETPFGVWLAGLDVAATGALQLPGSKVLLPPVVCYLDRGHGAAIRRARTRLSTGGENPVAIIRVPRERMVGSGIAASLFHEVGHQAISLLNLLPALRKVLRAKQLLADSGKTAWVLWERWISEIAADFWALTHLGIGATLGVFGVLSLPRAFVFRVSMTDPHPFPWVRAVLSCKLGEALFPHPQWRRLEAVWRSFYPLEGLDPERLALVKLLEATMPEFIQLLMNHRVAALEGRTVPEILRYEERRPERLKMLFKRWRARRGEILHVPPPLALAVLGQAKADFLLSPEEETRAVLSLLRAWALQRTLSLTGSPHSKCNCRPRPVKRKPTLILQEGESHA
jgi:hypothetical protein